MKYSTARTGGDGCSHRPKEIEIYCNYVDMRAYRLSEINVLMVSG